jgi:Ribbon-helix-helix protein, copG family
MSKGDFLLRLDPEVLEQVRKAAAAEGLSVSDFVRQGIELRLGQAGTPRSASRADLLAEIAAVALKLRAGFTLVPSAEVPDEARPGSWSGIIDQEAP